MKSQIPHKHNQGMMPAQRNQRTYATPSQTSKGKGKGKAIQLMVIVKLRRNLTGRR